MLQSIKPLYGRNLGASDGELGQVKDFYFDDQTWAIRYCVADTGSWLAGRQVLFAPETFESSPFGGVDQDSLLRVIPSRKRIEESPSFASHEPLSRRQEEDYHRYYGLSAYWQEPGIGLPDSLFAASLPADSRRHNQRPDGEGCLRSTRSATGFYLHATDGQIGYVSGFMVSDDWIIREILVETGNWYFEKIIVLRSADLAALTFSGSSVFLNLSRADLLRRMSREVVAARL